MAKIAPKVFNVTQGGGGEDFQVKATQGDFKKTYEALDKLGQREMQKELKRSLNASSKQARMRVRDSERDYLPSGMKKKFARVPAQFIGTKGHNVSLQWRQRLKNIDSEAINRGRLRHPLFGNRSKWYNQAIPAGFFTNSVAKEVPVIKSEMVQDISQIVERTLSV